MTFTEDQIQALMDGRQVDGYWVRWTGWKGSPNQGVALKGQWWGIRVKEGFDAFHSNRQPHVTYASVRPNGSWSGNKEDGEVNRREALLKFIEEIEAIPDETWPSPTPMEPARTVAI
jgi:hypothetical protein